MGVSGNTTWNFATVDNIAPLSSSLSPSDNATNIDIDENLVITFNENIQVGSVTEFTLSIFLKRVADDTTYSNYKLFDANVTISGNTLTIDPTVSLPASTAFYVIIDSGAVSDTSNNDFTGVTASTTWNFTTKEITPPSISTLTPIDNANPVPLAQTMTLQFDENIQAGSVATSTDIVFIKESGTNTILFQYSLDDAEISISTDTLTINPAGNLPSNNTVYIEVISGGISDSYNNDFLGFSGAGTWTLWTADETPPTLSVLTPLDEATNVSISGELILELSEAVQAGSVATSTDTIFIKKVSDDSIVYQYSIDDSEISASSDQLKITLSDYLPALTNLYIEITSGAIADTSSNDFTGISGSTIWNFHTYSNVVQTKKIASDGAANDRFGDSVSIDGSIAIVGAYGDSDNGAASGSAYIYVYNIDTYSWEETKIQPTLGAASEFYGGSVAISGDIAIVGARGTKIGGVSKGAAYIYKHDPSSNTWEETQLIASDGLASQYFGRSVAISGITAVVGAYGHNVSRGKVYIYTYDTITNGWNEAQVEASDKSASDQFGYSVGISGNEIIVGSPNDDDSATGSGSAYIYQFDYSVAISGGIAVVGAHMNDDSFASTGSAYIFMFDKGSNSWKETKLNASDAIADDFFGYTVSISGFNILIGASGRDDKGSSSGAVYYYSYDTNTNAWKESKVLAIDGAADDGFKSVSVSGNTALLGASYNTNSNGTEAGAVYFTDLLVKQSILKNETTEYKLGASDGAVDDDYGYSVSISGSSAIVGAPDADVVGADSGAAYIYVYDPNTLSWDETNITPSDKASGDSFGRSVSISGASVIIGAPFADNTGASSGSTYIYIFDGSSNSWEETKIVASDAAAGDEFGGSVAISGFSAIVGAFNNDDDGANSGSAYIYIYDSDTNVWDEKKVTASSGGASYDTLWI